ncbi:MAG TPA: tetratricopeptide repeat protein, partial [Pyrinomonadaceae bacterium]|nr:tetratricopeptide repeat protein [Pyrinomonadaceae bacterium]
LPRHTMMRRLALISATALALVLTAQTASAKDTWTSVRSQHFFLIGNASEKDIRRVATRLEQFRDVFTRLLKGVNFSSPVPTTVVVFKSDGSYKPYKPVVDGKVSDVAGYFQPGEEINYITLTTEQRGEDPFSTIYHEYVHLLVNDNFGKAAVPPWFNEGLAEYYSTFDIEDDRKVYLGRLVDNHILLLRNQNLIPLKTLFDVDYYSLHRNKRETKGLFYAQAWALVHYLINGNNGERMRQMGRFFDMVLKKTPTEQAFRDAFQTDFAGMEKELKKYIGGSSFRGQLATFERKLEFDAAMTSAPISEAEAQAHLGDLLRHTHRLDDAAAHLQRALTLDPDLGMAHASLGMVRMRQRKFDEARKHLRQAVAANAQNYLAHYYYAYVLSREGINEMGMVSGYADETAKEMRSALEKAINLKPDFAESYHLLAWVNMVRNEQLDEAVRLINKARSLAPGNDEYLFVLAQIYLHRQDLDGARRVIEPLAQSGADPQTRANAQSLLNAITSAQAQMERYQKMREASAEGGGGTSGGEGPRLLRRDEARESEPESEEVTEAKVEDAMRSALEAALRQPLEGETRAQGFLTKIECSAKGLVFHIKLQDRVLRLESSSFADVDISAYTQEAGSEITCGARKPESTVIVTYRAASGGKAKTDGVMTAMEFVPASFQLKQ